MTTRQTIRGRRSCLLYLVWLILLAISVGVILSLFLFLGLPGTAGGQQRAEQAMAAAQASLQSQQAELTAARSTLETQAAALGELQPAATAQATMIVALESRLETCSAELEAARQELASQATQLDEAEVALQNQSNQLAQLQAAGTVEAAGYQTAIAAARWPRVKNEQFNISLISWCIGAVNDQLMRGQRLIVGGRYRWEATALRSFVWQCPVNTNPLTDFVASVEADRIDGSAQAQYGIQLRTDDAGSHYLFMLRESGDYRFAVHDQRGLRNLISWTPSPAIRSNRANRMTVIAQGADFRLYINDQFVGQARDDTIPEGGFALVIQLDNAGDQAIIEFDNLELFAP